MQSDFQRTFMLLRPLDAKDSASSGFCRMERRGSRGKLIFTVQGVQRSGALRAVLVTGDGRDTKVVPCGELRLDARGHGSLTYAVDALTSSVTAQYRAVGVVEMAEDGVDLMMIGFFGKGRPFDREAVERVAAQSLGLAAPPKAPMPEEPRREEGVPPTEKTDLVREEKTPESMLPPNIWSQPVPEPGTAPALGLPEELADAIWPDSAAALRELFERFEVVSPVTGAENELFVSIPMNGGAMSIDHYLLGVRLENGYIRAIGYGIPGDALTPPVGLVGYTWMDTPLGGYWLKWEEVA